MIGKWNDIVDGGGTREIIESGLYKTGDNVGGMNVLNFDGTGMSFDEKWAINQEWLQDAIDRGDNIRVISNPLLEDHLNDIGNPNELSFFGEEVHFLESIDYIYDNITKTFILN